MGFCGIVNSGLIFEKKPNKHLFGKVVEVLFNLEETLLKRMPQPK